MHITSCVQHSGCYTALKKATQREHLIHHDSLLKPAEEKRQ